MLRRALLINLVSINSQTGLKKREKASSVTSKVQLARKVDLEASSISIRLTSTLQLIGDLLDGSHQSKIRASVARATLFLLLVLLRVNIET